MGSVSAAVLLIIVSRIVFVISQIMFIFDCPTCGLGQAFFKKIIKLCSCPQSFGNPVGEAGR